MEFVKVVHPNSTVLFSVLIKGKVGALIFPNQLWTKGEFKKKHHRSIVSRFGMKKKLSLTCRDVSSQFFWLNQMTIIGLLKGRTWMRLYRLKQYN